MNDSIATLGVDENLLRHSAVKYLGSLERQPWWTDWHCVVTGEGGRNSLVTNAMLSAVSCDPWKLGFYEYGRYLQQTYGLMYQDNLSASLDSLLETLDEIDITPLVTELPSELETLLGFPSGDALRAYTLKTMSLDNALSVLNTEQEREFMVAYSNVWSVEEASILIGVTPADGLRIYNRVKQRARRYLMPTVCQGTLSPI